MEANFDTKYTRDINCLREKDKNIRIQGLKRIIQALNDQPLEEVHQLFASKLKLPLLELLKDPSDKCKELAVEFLFLLISSKKILFDDIPFLISSLHSRLGTEPSLETCEEIRIQEIKLLSKIIENYTLCIPPIMSEVTDILFRLGKDKCPQVKNIVSSCIIFLSINGLRFSSKKLLEGIRNNLSHQQFKVRSSTIEAIGALSLNESGIADELFLDFKKTQVDRRTEVRLTAYNVITEVMINLNYVELKKIEGKYIYLILGGFSDPDCENKIQNLLNKIFIRIRQSAAEYQEDTAEAVDENWLAVRNIKEIIDFGLADIQEWTIQDYYRSRAVNSIGRAVFMAKNQIVLYLEKILKVFFKAYSNSDDIKYLELLENVAKSISQFCVFSEVFDIYLKIFSDPISIQEKASGLKIFGKMIFSLETNFENLGFVMDFLSSNDFSIDVYLFESLHSCLIALVSTFGPLIKKYEEKIFYMLLVLENTLKFKVHATMQELAEHCGYSEICELYSLQLPTTLLKILKNYKAWESSSYERTQFRNLIIRSGKGIKTHWATILDVLVENSAREKESEVRYDMLVVLESIISCSDLHECIHKSGKRVLVDIISPTCAWKVGASSVQIRISSLLCLQKLFEFQIIDPDVYWTNWDSYFQGIKGCMDDDWDNELRIAALNVSIPLLLYYGSSIPTPHLTLLNTELMKRMDDSLDHIRITATYPLQLALNILKEKNEPLDSFSKNIKVLFLHLDDDSPQLSNSVMEVLNTAITWKKEEVLEIAKEKRNKQRHPERVDFLIEKHN